MSDSNDAILESQLRSHLSRPCVPDFDTWRMQHESDVAYLNPIVSKLARRRQKFFSRLISASLVATLVVGVFFSLIGSQQPTFAQTIRALDHAKSITWTMDFYTRIQSVDGKRTWLQKTHHERAFKTPGLYRDSIFNDQGKLNFVEIVDLQSSKVLRMNMIAKKASLKRLRSQQYDPRGPFHWINDILKSQPLELIAEQTIDGVKVNDFRCLFGSSNIRSIDIRIESKTKDLVRICTPFKDHFDPDTDPDRNHPAEKEFSLGQPAGTVMENIVLNSEVPATFFDLTPPADFEIEHEPTSPPVTEEQLVEWLEVTARFNGGQFVDSELGVAQDKHNQADRKAPADLTREDLAYLKLWRKHYVENDHRQPIIDFAEEFAVPGTFRYLGKGVTLGASDRFVCWYKLKSTGKYRAIKGDLSVQDIDPQNLPLPVEE